MTDTTCAVQVCDRTSYARGLCQAHYMRWRKFGDPGTEAIGSYQTRGVKCAEPECENPVYARTFCKSHYEARRNPQGRSGRGRRWRLGERKWEGVQCRVEGCERPVKYAGLCTMHYSRVRTTGDPGGAARRKAEWGAGTVNSNGYREIHRDGRRVLEHRYVMEQIVGRPLEPHETVHHKNGNRADNRPENLELWVSTHPPGQEAHDLVSWAEGILMKYGALVHEGRV